MKVTGDRHRSSTELGTTSIAGLCVYDVCSIQLNAHTVSNQAPGRSGIIAEPTVAWQVASRLVAIAALAGVEFIVLAFRRRRRRVGSREPACDDARRCVQDRRLPCFRPA